MSQIGEFEREVYIEPVQLPAPLTTPATPEPSTPGPSVPIEQPAEVG